MDEQRYCVTFPEDAVSISVTAGTTVLAAAIAAGLKPDAPCGGRGTCGKCLVRITAGRDHLTMAGGPVPGDELLPACQLMVGGDVSAVFPRHGENRILTGGISMADTAAAADGEFFAMAAFDVGTTSLVGYLLDGRTGARLAAGIIDFEGVGPEIPVESLVRLPIVEPRLENGAVCGTIDVLDVRFGSLWTNIPRALFLETGVHHGDRVSITIENDTRCVYRNIILYAKSFADVYVGEALAYINSLDCVAVAINQGSFARAYNIGTGNSWRIRIEPFRGFR